MSWAEIAGALLGLVNIVLVIRRSVWNFPVAMVMVVLVGWVLAGTKLYSEAGLQAFFFAANAWGWWMWSRAQGETAEVPVGRMTAQARLVWALVTAVLSLSLGWVLHTFTDAVLPFADSAVAGASIAAQILLALRRVENWALWIAIDVVSVGLYLNRELYALAALYVAFGVLSVAGWREWQRVAA